MNKAAQIDFDDINIVGVIFGLIGAGIGILVASRMDGGLFIKLLSALICAVVCYFVGSKITDE
jgi:uncharacterized membrane protein YfcA